MKQIVTLGIVLGRTDFNEADRIITFLTPDNGKISAIAKGVRKSGSKLAGGIELFSVSELSFILGRGEVKTLTSARLQVHFPFIADEFNRTQAGFEALNILQKSTHEHPEEAYFILLRDTLELFNNPDVLADLTLAWFYARLLRLEGRTPNMATDIKGVKLQPGDAFNFDFASMAFAPHSSGKLSAEHIKLARLLSSSSYKITSRLKVQEDLVQPTLLLMRSIHKYHS